MLLIVIGDKQVPEESEEDGEDDIEKHGGDGNKVGLPNKRSGAGYDEWIVIDRLVAMVLAEL